MKKAVKKHGVYLAWIMLQDILRCPKRIKVVFDVLKGMRERSAVVAVKES